MIERLFVNFDDDVICVRCFSSASTKNDQMMTSTSKRTKFFRSPFRYTVVIKVLYAKFEGKQTNQSWDISNLVPVPKRDQMMTSPSKMTKKFGHLLGIVLKKLHTKFEGH